MLKQLRSTFFTAVIFFTGWFLLVGASEAALNVDRLSVKDIQQVKELIEKLTPMIQQRDGQGTLPTLTFQELYAPLNKKEKKFLKQFQSLKGKNVGVTIPYRGIAKGEENLVTIRGQKVKIEGQWKELPPQFLPKNVYKSYLEMMGAMKHDLKKRLYVESGYRSSAFQLYLFVYYLKNHDYSVRETVKWVALPGYSEHGSSQHQAIDFINEAGISGETNPVDFETLPEYHWLLKYAKKFGFVLSYPKNVPGITFEPWHWRYEGAK